MKYESNTPMFSKDIARKPFFVRTGQDIRNVRMYVRTDIRTRVMLYAPPPPHYNGGGIITGLFCMFVSTNNPSLSLHISICLLLDTTA